MSDDQVMLLCDRIRETAFSLHSYLRHGHLENVYENGLRHRLTKAGLHVLSQVPLDVRDEDGTVLGSFFADLLVEKDLIIEVKACKTLINDHTAQLLGYLRATGVRHGLLINFGAPRLEVRKYVL